MDTTPTEECIRALQSDRLIMLNISDSQTSFSVQIQQTVLEAASPWFQKALQDERFVEGQSGVINFGEDDVDAWKLVVYWLLHHKLPLRGDNGDREIHFVSRAKCWILGDRYGVTGLQNEAMLQLLESADALCFRLKAVQYSELIAITPADSVLMRLLGEEAAHQYRFGSDLISDAPTLDAGIGFWPAFLIGQFKIQADPDYLSCRLQRLGIHEHAHWSEYMVGERPILVEYLKDEE
ncbi:hypothetical protein CERZMDRAFT_93257 [Cercospora zeae-maydis SCOH1-5]|uniref:BTB domain-containing protein n=1 Tax=Cercospora zeae-maydis SCOH1-5 TaxID=717836 RepID=A0A6A6FUL6_9PEZI|nr:hypothetical protein CERZMDRAFT_93257 [Cercospora zeae-maydis SCOH1-5]